MQEALTLLHVAAVSQARQLNRDGERLGLRSGSSGSVGDGGGSSGSLSSAAIRGTTVAVEAGNGEEQNDASTEGIDSGSSGRSSASTTRGAAGGGITLSAAARAKERGRAKVEANTAQPEAAAERFGGDGDAGLSRDSLSVASGGSNSEAVATGASSPAAAASRIEARRRDRGNKLPTADSDAPRNASAVASAAAAAPRTAAAMGVVGGVLANPKATASAAVGALATPTTTASAAVSAAAAVAVGGSKMPTGMSKLEQLKWRKAQLQGSLSGTAVRTRPRSTLNALDNSRSMSCTNSKHVRTTRHSHSTRCDVVLPHSGVALPAGTPRPTYTRVYCVCRLN